MKTGPTPDNDNDGNDDDDDDGGGDGDGDVMQEETYRVQKAWGELSFPPHQPAHLCSLVLVGYQRVGGGNTRKKFKCATSECHQVNQDQKQNLAAPNHGATQEHHSETATL